MFIVGAIVAAVSALVWAILFIGAVPALNDAVSAVPFWAWPAGVVGGAALMLLGRRPSN